MTRSSWCCSLTVWFAFACLPILWMKVDLCRLNYSILDLSSPEHRYGTYHIQNTAAQNPVLTLHANNFLFTVGTSGSEALTLTSRASLAPIYRSKGLNRLPWSSPSALADCAAASLSCFAGMWFATWSWGGGRARRGELFYINKFICPLPASFCLHQNSKTLCRIIYHLPGMSSVWSLLLFTPMLAKHTWRTDSRPSLQNKLMLWRIIRIEHFGFLD